jgi:hypothetical protein
MVQNQKQCKGKKTIKQKHKITTQKLKNNIKGRNNTKL